MEGTANIEVVVEPVGDRGPNGECRPGIEIQDRLSEHVGRRMPQHISPRVSGIGDHRKPAVDLDRSFEIRLNAVDHDRDRGVSQAWADVGRDRQTGHSGGIFVNGSVGKGERHRHCRPQHDWSGKGTGNPTTNRTSRERMAW